MREEKIYCSRPQGLENVDFASSYVITEELGPDGDLQNDGWENMNDQTDDAYLYLNTFASYFKMIRLLEEELVVGL